MKELGKKDRFFEFFRKLTLALVIIALSLIGIVVMIQIAKWF